MPTRPWAGDTNFSSGPRAGETTKDQPTDAELLQGLVAGRGLPTNHLNYLLNRIDDFHGTGDYGDGSDGDATISSNTSLDRTYYYNELTIDSGAHLDTAGYLLFCQRLVISTGCTVGRDGNDGDPANGGAALADTALGGAPAGGDGGSLGAGSNGGNAINSASGATGGAGGDANAASGGTPGSASALAATRNQIRHKHTALTGAVWRALDDSWAHLEGGSGGGGGGSDGTQAAGGGSGGGVVAIFAKELVLEGDIVARGGNGGNSANTDDGGGGGGGGGMVWLGTRRREGGGSILVTGGTGGIGQGAGENGVAGQDGLVIELSD